MRRVSPKTIVYLLGFLSALAYLAYSVTSTRPPTGKKAEGKPAKTQEQAAKKPEAIRLVQAAPADADFSRYQVILGRNIFSPPAPPLPPPTIPPIPRPYVFKPGDEIPQKPPTPPAPSLSKWSYVGYVTVDGKTIGIIQNDEDDSYRELKLGEDFQGYKVDVISREEMGLSFRSTKASLKRPLDFPIVPLEGAPAPGAPAGGRGPGPGARRGGGGPPEH